MLMIVLNKSSLSEELRCMICGKECRSVGHHVRVAHGVSARDYRDSFGIPRSKKLTSSEVRAKFAAQAIERRLPDHVHSLKADARKNAMIGAQVRSELRSIGRYFGSPRTITDEVLIGVVSAAEGGARPYQVCRDRGISWSGFHAALKRSPSLLARYKALPIKRGRVSLPKC